MAEVKIDIMEEQQSDPLVINSLETNIWWCSAQETLTALDILTLQVASHRRGNKAILASRAWCNTFRMLS